MEHHTAPPGQDVQRKRQQLAHLSMVHIADLNAHLEELPPRDRALGAVTLMDDLRSQLELVSRVRTAAIMELRAEGLSVSSIAMELGISRQQVHKLLREAGSAPAPVSALALGGSSAVSDVKSDWDVSPAEFEVVLREQFKLYGQPIVALKDGVQVAIELLPRWETRQGRLEGLFTSYPTLPPAGLTDQVTEWVIRTAGRSKKRLGWLREGLRIHLNIDIRSEALIGVIGDLCEESALSPEFVVLEIPELQLTSSDHHVVTALRTQGFAVVVDDFGTGYSSLSMLRQLTLAGMKLDSTFVAEFGTNRSIVEACCRLATSIGLAPYALGIETADQGRCLVEIGYTFGQGSLLGRLESL